MPSGILRLIVNGTQSPELGHAIAGTASVKKLLAAA
jgi:hypothetical protein